MLDRHPIARLDEYASFLNGKKFFSTLDLVKPFNQILIKEEDKPKTTIITPFGLFKFLHMTFGLKNALQTLRRIINEVLLSLDFVYAYIDDILIASSSFEEQL